MKRYGQKTENELVKAIAELEKQLEAGEATAETASRLRRYRAELEAIRSVRYGRQW